MSQGIRDRWFWFFIIFVLSRRITASGPPGVEIRPSYVGSDGGAYGDVRSFFSCLFEPFPSLRSMSSVPREAGWLRRGARSVLTHDVTGVVIK